MNRDPLVDWANPNECTDNFGVIFGIDFLKGQCDSGKGAVAGYFKVVVNI